MRAVAVALLAALVPMVMGFIWYNPVLLLAIPGAALFWRSHRRIFVFSLLLTVLYNLIYVLLVSYYFPKIAP